MLRNAEFTQTETEFGGWCDRGFLVGALGRGVAGAVTIGAMVEFADQPHRSDPTQRRVPVGFGQHYDYDNCHWSIAT